MILKRLNFINLIIFAAILFVTISAIMILFDRDNFNSITENDKNPIRARAYNMPVKASLELWAGVFGFRQFALNANENIPGDIQTTASSSSDMLANYSLTGTITGEPAFASAIILKKSENKYYTKKLNDSIENLKIIGISRGHITLTDEFKNRIIMKTEALLKLENEQFGFTKTAAANIEIEHKQIVQPAAQDQPQSHNLFFTRDEINNYIYKELENILTTANIVPHFENNKMTGVRFNKLYAESILARRFGIKWNDIIKSVNGRQIDSIEKGMKLWDNLKNENYLLLEIIRDDMPVILTINIK